MSRRFEDLVNRERVVPFLQRWLDRLPYPGMIIHVAAAVHVKPLYTGSGRASIESLV